MLRKSDRRLRIFDVHDVDVVLAVLWIVVPNTREEALVLRIVVRHASFFVVGQQVFAVDGEVAAVGRHIGFGLCLQLERGHLLRAIHYGITTLVYRFAIIKRVAAVIRGVERLSIENGPITILFTVVVRQKRHRIFRVVLVNRCIRIRTNGQYDEGRVPHHD